VPTPGGGGEQIGMGESDCGCEGKNAGAGVAFADEVIMDGLNANRSFAI